jgi:hypothetical protein
MMFGGVAALGILLVLAALVAGVRMSGEPVSRARLERFARRQHLTLTSANAALVVRSLALTRRWRALGLWTGLATGLLWALREGSLTINFLTAFLGWFVGAVVAEWRTAGVTPPEDRRRVASLERRTVAAYLRTGSRLLLGAALAGLVAAFLATVAASGLQEARPVLEAAAWLLVAGVGLALVALTLRHVVTRPQPPASPDVIAADDALRARAANVLAGSAIAAAGVPTAALLGLLGLSRHDDESWASLGLGVMVVELIVGFVVAMTASPARTRRSHLPEAAATR